MRQRVLWSVLIGLCVVGFACFAFPLYVIRPFRAQGASELSAALAVKSWGPWVAVVCAGLSFVVLAWIWQRAGTRTRAVAAGLCVLTSAFAGLARVNVYERMFHPLPAPGFALADKAKVDPDDMVLTVALSGEARAYPIRTMGYHHIANDWVGGRPIVATY